MKRILLSLGLVISAALAVWLGSSAGARPNQEKTPPVESSPADPFGAPTPIESPPAVDPAISVEDPPIEPARSAGATSAGSKKRNPASAAGHGEPAGSAMMGSAMGHGEVTATRKTPARNAVLSVALKHGNAKDMAAALQDLFPGVGQYEIDSRGMVLLIRLPQSQVETFKKVAELLDQPKPRAEQEVKIFILQNSQANDVANLLMQLYPGSPNTIVPDVRTNTLIIRGPKGEGTFLSEIEALLKRLDEPGSPQLDTGKKPTTTEPGRSGTDMRVPPLLPAADDADMNELRQKYQALENQALALANSSRQSPLNKEQSDSLAKKLAEVVTQAFDARQQLQRAEVASIARQVELTNQRIAEREKIRQQMVDRRVNDLLNPQTRWDQSKAEAPSRDAQSSNVPMTARPVDSDIPVRSATTTIAVDGSNTQLSQATSLAKRFEALRQAVSHLEGILKEHPRHERAETFREEIKRDRRELDLLQKEHAARMRLMQIDLKQAQTEVESAQTDFSRLEKLKGQNVVPASEFDKARRELESAELRLERAKTVYDLFHEIDARGEAPVVGTDISPGPQALNEPLGEVKEVDEQFVTVSCLQSNSLRPREILDVLRSEGENYAGPFRLIAKIEIVEVSEKTAIGRIRSVQSRKVDDKVETEKPEPGDCVNRPGS